MIKFYLFLRFDFSGTELIVSNFKRKKQKIKYYLIIDLRFSTVPVNISATLSGFNHLN